jgi:hypothetical protein
MLPNPEQVRQGLLLWRQNLHEANLFDHVLAAKV